MDDILTGLSGIPAYTIDIRDEVTHPKMYSIKIEYLTEFTNMDSVYGVTNGIFFRKSINSQDFS